jgi:hypothetical protein
MTVQRAAASPTPIPTPIPSRIPIPIPFPILALALSLLVALSVPPPAAAEGFVLDNGRLRAQFDDHGLVSITALASGRTVALAPDPTSLTLDGQELDLGALGPAEIEMTSARLAYRTVRDPYTFDVVYELRPTWGFVTKQIIVTTVTGRTFRLGRITPLSSTLSLTPSGGLDLSDGRFGALLRFPASAAPASATPAASASTAPPAWGLFLVLQNPFMDWQRSGREIKVSYVPDMDWSAGYGPFASDRLCLGIYELSGTRFPARAVPEWTRVDDYEKLLRESPTIDAAEVDALTDCVRSFLLTHPGRSLRVHIPWCENDYQIDVGTPEGVEEYKRIMDRAAELGASHLLYTPANSRLSRLEDNADSWGWENLLWFGLGQKLRKGEWDPRRDEVPAPLKDMIGYAASKNLKLMAYAYPSLPFLQRPEWTAWAGDKAGGRSGADTGLRSFQDWWLEMLTAFMRKTGAAGFSFDHWWIAYDGASSKYAQWSGARRILETLRRERFDVVIDGRQQYQNFGPWTWLAGSYPHPVLTDEQPESFKAFPDLSTDRVSADRQRFAAWVYRVERFCPPEIMPGFITHQTTRSDARGVMRRDRFRTKDWDVLGWKYSLLSSIATAPFHHVINFIPARDPEEYAALSEADKAWFRKWLDWTDENARFLRALRPIIGPPMAGRVDGTAAIVEDRGLVFLFNPNPERLRARFKLDGSIGLGPAEGRRFMIKELHPQEGRLIASAEGYWEHGSEVVLPMDGREAAVLEVFPAPEKVEAPILFNVRGDAALQGTRLALTGLTAEAGTRQDVLVLVPAGSRVRAVSVNGVAHPFRLVKDRVTLQVGFALRAFGRSQQVGKVPAGFRGGAFKARITVPERVFAQLAERKKQWPVSYTEDDLLAPWLAPWRLLLYVAVAEPLDSMEVGLKVNGQPVEVRKAYNSVYPRRPERTFLGWYADLSRLRPDSPVDIEVTLPELEPGRFQGLFFDNVETEYTQRFLAPPARKK